MADIKINGATPSGFYYGGTAASAVYYGSTKLWEAASPQTTVVIGGKTYPTVTMPDGHEWLALNLDYAWSGLSVPTSGASAVTTSQAMYYDYDESTYGWNGLKRGLLYNGYAVKDLDTNKATLCPGWHVPTKDEFDALVSAIGGAANGAKLKSTTGWTNAGSGTDDYGFAAYPSGQFNSLGFGSITAAFRIWATISGATSVKAYFLGLAAADQEISVTTNSRQYQYSVRLIKDY